MSALVVVLVGAGLFDVWKLFLVTDISFLIVFCLLLVGPVLLFATVPPCRGWLGVDLALLAMAVVAWVFTAAVFPQAMAQVISPAMIFKLLGWGSALAGSYVLCEAIEVFFPAKMQR